MGISMIVDLASMLKERDAVSTHSASGRRRGFLHKHVHTHTHTHPRAHNTHTNSVIGREMQRGGLYNT